MGGMKHDLDDHQVSLKAPLRRALQILEDEIIVLAKKGPAAYADRIEQIGHTGPAVTWKIIAAVAEIMRAEDPRRPT